MHRGLKLLHGVHDVNLLQVDICRQIELGVIPPKSYRALQRAAERRGLDGNQRETGFNWGWSSTNCTSTGALMSRCSTGNPVKAKSMGRRKSSVMTSRSDCRTVVVLC